MRSTMFVVLMLSGGSACSQGNLDAASSDNGRNVALALTDTVYAWNKQPRVAATGMRTLASGSRLDATWGQTITSRTNRAGETVTIIVTADVKDDSGRVVIPSGATVELLITELTAATSRGDADGKLALRVTSTTIRGRQYALRGDVTSVPHTLGRRGMGKAEVVKVGTWTAVGAPSGHVTGRDTRNAVINGAVGAVGGATVAAQSASRDVVVRIGSMVLITLTGPFTVAGNGR